MEDHGSAQGVEPALMGGSRSGTVYCSEGRVRILEGYTPLHKGSRRRQTGETDPGPGALSGQGGKTSTRRRPLRLPWLLPSFFSPLFNPNRISTDTNGTRRPLQTTYQCVFCLHGRTVNTFAPIRH